VFLLAAVVLVGPLAMVFTSCALTGAMCEGACGVSSCALIGASFLTMLVPVALVLAPARSRLLTIDIAGLEPPPKSLTRSVQLA